jgi:hypothetical protein
MLVQKKGALHEDECDAPARSGPGYAAVVARSGAGLPNQIHAM